MPFRSKKQRAYLYANKPEMAKNGLQNTEIRL